MEETYLYCETTSRLVALVQTDRIEDTKEELARPTRAEASSLFTTGRGFVG